MSIAIGVKFYGVFVSERLWGNIRRVCLHGSCAGFSMDFVHSCIGRYMFAAQFFMDHHEVIVTWSAFATVVIIYIDDTFHKEKEKHQKNENGDWHPSPLTEGVD